MRHVIRTCLTFVMLALAASTAFGQSWIGAGTPVATASGAQVGAKSCADGADGVYIAWVDFRGPDADLYVQHLDDEGAVVTGWPTNGLAVCTAIRQQLDPALQLDAEGGVYVAWTDFRTNSSDVYLTRIHANGTRATGWSAQGDLVSSQIAIRRAPRLSLDPAGGVYVAFERVTVSLDIFLTRIDSTGVKAAGWPVPGIALTSSLADEDTPAIATDASGACVLAWVNEDLNGGDLRAARIWPNGTVATGWTAADGLDVLPTAQAQTDVQLVTRADGGVLLYFLDDSQGPENTDVRATGVDSSGVALAGWSGSVGVLTAVATDALDFAVRGDGANGAVAVSREYDLANDISSLLAIRHDAGHTLAWPDTVLLTTTGVTSAPVVVRDSQGAFLVAFADTFPGHNAQDLHATRLAAADGTVLSGWTANTGNAVCTESGDQSSPGIVPSANGSGIVVWIDGRGSDLDVYAARVGADGVVPTQLALASFTARYDAVELVWFSDGQGLQTVTLERREDEGVWIALRTVFRDGEGRFVCIDREVRPGTSYDYRVRTGADVSESIRVSVPFPNPLAMSISNPSLGEVQGRVTLASNADAELTLHDITGRVRYRLQLRGAGVHPFALVGTALEPGVYLAELRQSGSSATTKFAVVR